MTYFDLMRREIKLTKKNVIRVILGFFTSIISSILIVNYMEGWHMSRWPIVINGAIAVFVIFPPIIQWARLTQVKHVALSRGIVIFLYIWSILWGVVSILTITGVLK